jgi:hypothetical protein
MFVIKSSTKISAILGIQKTHTKGRISMHIHHEVMASKQGVIDLMMNRTAPLEPPEK